MSKNNYIKKFLLSGDNRYGTDIMHPKRHPTSDAGLILARNTP